MTVAVLGACGVAVTVAVLGALPGCRCEPPAPPAEHAGTALPAGAPQDGAGGEDRDFSAAPGYDPDWRLPPAAARALTTPGDPLQGRFGIAELSATLPPGRRYVAAIDTDLGTLDCELWPERAPLAVASFAGLANGVRPFATPEGWQRAPAYDGASIARVVPGVAWWSGGSPRAAGPGAGYVIADERWPGMHHERAGLLFLASRGRDTGAMAFGITLGPAPMLEPPSSVRAGRGANTVFGECGPAAALARFDAVALAGSRPAAPLAIRSVRVTRQ